MKCKVSGCMNESYCRGMCKKHYSRFIRTGSTDDREKKLCSVEGCECKVLAKGYCRKHYDMVRRFGEIKQVEHNTICKVCGEKARSKGFCKRHYADYYKGLRDITGKWISDRPEKDVVRRDVSDDSV